MTRSKTILILLISAIALLLVGGCSSMGVEVWQRDVLAKPEMQLENESIDRSIDDHIYFSKEAASGGRGFAGGGCGCN